MFMTELLLEIIEVLCVCVVLFNLSDEKCTVEAGNRISYLIIEQCFTPKFVKASKFMDEKRERGEIGFGSFSF